MVDVLAVGSGVGEPLEALGALERLLTRVEPAVLRSKERCEIPFDKKDLQLYGKYLGEVMLVLERLVAVGALVRTLVWK